MLAIARSWGQARDETAGFPRVGTHPENWLTSVALPLRWSLVPLALLLAATPARGGVLDDPNVGGIGFGGPTTGDLTAIYWNPAALGLMSGVQAMLGVSAWRGSLSVKRDPIAGAAGAREFAPVTGRNTHSPISWPPGPGTFAAVGAAIGNRFTLALAVYTPSYQRATYPAASDGEEPTRYHAVDVDLRNVALVTGLAFRIGDLRIGVAPGFLFSTGRLVFDEDTSQAFPTRRCGVADCVPEDPLAAARYDVGSGLGVFDSTLSYTVAGGLHYRRGKVEIGLAVNSRPLGNVGGGIEVRADRTTVSPPSRLGPGAVVCPPDHPQGCVSGHMRYDLPDIFTAGLTWHVTPPLAITAVVRWLTFSRHDRIDIRVVGPANGSLRTAQLSERLVLHRGFQDVIEGRLRVEGDISYWLKVGAAVRADTGAVRPDSLSPAAVGGPTFEPAAMAEFRVGGWLRLIAGYAFTVMPAASTGTSAFDPGAAARCDQAQGDLNNPSCVTRENGAARPTAAGRYSLLQHTATLTAIFKF
jgi:long-subunit fatty acid transport protein